MYYILRAKTDPLLTQYPPESIIAWNTQPVLEIAPAEFWEAVEDLEGTLDLAPKLSEKVEGEEQQVEVSSEVFVK